MYAFSEKLIGAAKKWVLLGTLIAASLVPLTTPYPYLALLPGLAILILLGSARPGALPYLFYGIVALIPFGAYRGLTGQLGFLRLHWLLAMLLLIMLGGRILISKHTPQILRRNTLIRYMAIFFALNILTLTRSYFPAASATFILLLAAGYLLVAMGMSVISRQGFARTLPAVIVGSVFISALLAVLGAAFRIPLFISSTGDRILGAAPDPNNMALMIIFSIPLAVYFLLTARSTLARIGMCLILIVDITAVIATFSRGGAVILFITVFLVLWEFRGMLTPHYASLLIGAGGIAAALIIILTPQSYQDRIASLHNDHDFALRRRASYLLVARDLTVEHPFLGSGPNTFSRRYAETDTGRRFRRKRESGKRFAHNTYVEVLVGSGLIGLLMFLAIPAFALHSFSDAARRFNLAGERQLGVLSIAYRTSFISLLLYLMLFSEVNHKYLLVALVASQVGQFYAKQLQSSGGENA